MIDSKLINSYFGLSTIKSQDRQEPERKTEDNQDQESIIEEQLNGNEICDTRANSEINNSFAERRISNPSVFDTSFKEDSESSDLSGNGDNHYYTETIKYLKELYKDEFNYSKSINYMTTKDYNKFAEIENLKAKLEKQNLNNNNKKNKPSYIPNAPFNFVGYYKVNDYFNVSIFFNPFFGYRWIYFSTKSIIPNGNTEKYPVMPQDKKDDCRNLKEGSKIKKEEPKIDEPKVDEPEIEEYIPRNQRIKNKKKFNAKYNRNNYYNKGNNYNNRNNNRQSNYIPSNRHYKRSNKSEY